MDDADKELAYFSAHMAKDCLTCFKLYTEHGITRCIDDGSVHFDAVVVCGVLLFTAVYFSRHTSKPLYGCLSISDKSFPLYSMG